MQHIVSTRAGVLSLVDFATGGTLFMFNKSCTVGSVDVGSEHGTSKSHAQLTQPFEGVEVHLDWVSVTLPENVPLDTITSRFFGQPLDQFVRTEKELHGYRTRYQWGSVLILADGSPEQGVHIDLSGQGVRQVEQMVFALDATGIGQNVAHSWPEWFRDAILHGGSFSRVDLAGDQITRTKDELIFTVQQVIDSLERGDWRSWFAKFHVERGFTKVQREGRTDIELTGLSVYIGSKQSRCFVCVYDKGMERRAKGYECESQWVRTEMRFKHERANSIAFLLADDSDCGRVFASVLKEYIDFLDPESDGSGNVSRRAVASWWDEFCGAVERVKLTFAKAEKGLREKKHWLSYQVSVSLAMLRRYYVHVETLAGGGEKEGFREFMRYFSELIQSGDKRLKDYHYEKLRSWEVA